VFLQHADAFFNTAHSLALPPRLTEQQTAFVAPRTSAATARARVAC
jgi:hypothetical protein